MTDIHLDYETFSDLDIRKVGAYRYTESPDFEVLMLGYAFDDGPIQVWVPKELFDLKKIRPTLSANYQLKVDKYLTNDDTDIAAAMADRAITKYAHNAEFERCCTKQLTQWRLPDWDEYRCTAALCSTLALPRGLEQSGQVLGIGGKDPMGSKLMTVFSKPRKPTKADGRTRILPMDEQPIMFEKELRSPAELFIEYCMYCAKDVQQERTVKLRLKAFTLDSMEQKIWVMNCQANERGVPIDVPNVKKAWSIVEQYIERDGGTFREITGLNVTQGKKANEWFNANGLDLPNMQGENTIDPILEKIKTGEIDVLPAVATALQTFRTAGRSSVKKLETMLDFANADGRVNGTSIHHGAQPGRYTGKFIQPHNFARPSRAIGDTMQAFDIINTGDFDLVEFCYRDPMEAVSSCLRHYIKADEGHELLVSDFSSVEPRGICWLADQDDALEEYRQSIDRYVKFSANMKGTTYESMMERYESGDSEADFLRQGGKVGIIQCGYQSAKKSVQSAAEKNFGLVLTLPEADTIVKAYRKQHPKVVQLWHDLGEAAINAVRTGKLQRVGKLLIGVKDIFLFIKLPSGRKIAYPEPRIEMQTAPWDRSEIHELTEEYNEIVGTNPQQAVIIRDMILELKRRPKRPTVTYWGRSQDRPGKWERRSTYGGKLCQNATEGICRDLLTNAMIKAEPHGINYIMLVHDELVNEVTEDAFTIDQYNDIICDLPEWAKGFPLAASGYIAKHYKK